MKNAVLQKHAVKNAKKCAKVNKKCDFPWFLWFFTYFDSLSFMLKVNS